MSKCYPNWQRLPNSRMDRQHRPDAFLRVKAQVDAAAYMKMPQEKAKAEQEKKKTEEILQILDEMAREAHREEEEELRLAALKLGVDPSVLRRIVAQAEEALAGNV